MPVAGVLEVDVMSGVLHLVLLQGELVPDPQEPPLVVEVRSVLTCPQAPLSIMEPSHLCQPPGRGTVLVSSFPTLVIQERMAPTGGEMVSPECNEELFNLLV